MDFYTIKIELDTGDFFEKEIDDKDLAWLTYNDIQPSKQIRRVKLYFNSEVPVIGQSCRLIEFKSF